MPCVWQTTARPATSEEPPSPDPHQDQELRDWCEDDQPWKNIKNLPEGWIEQKEWFEDDHNWKDSDNILKAVLKHIVLYCGIQEIEALVSILRRPRFSPASTIIEACLQSNLN